MSFHTHCFRMAARIGPCSPSSIGFFVKTGSGCPFKVNGLIFGVFPDLHLTYPAGLYRLWSSIRVIFSLCIAMLRISPASAALMRFGTLLPEQHARWTFPSMSVLFLYACRRHGC